MKHIMNIQKFNVKAAAAVAAAVAGLCGCSDWTRPEALDVAPEMQESSEETLAAIRAFKQTDHKIVVLGMEATPDAPVARYQHVTSMPDSADYIYIRNLVGGLNGAIAPEIAEVRSKKGTKVLADVDYMSIQEAWQDMQDDKIDAGEPQGTEDEFAAYCKEQTEAQLACCSTYGCDGIMVSYNGSATFDWHRTGRAAFLNAVADWYGQNSSKEMIVRGTLNLIAQNTVPGSDDLLYDWESFLGNCRYIIYAIGENTIDGDVNLGINRILRSYSSFPADKFIVEATVPDPSDPGTQIGMTPARAAEYVLVENESFSKLGLCVENAEDDYFNIGNSYINVRRAITVLNTEPSVDENPSATEE